MNFPAQEKLTNNVILTTASQIESSGVALVYLS